MRSTASTTSLMVRKQDGVSLDGPCVVDRDGAMSAFCARRLSRAAAMRKLRQRTKGECPWPSEWCSYVISAVVPRNSL